MEAFPEDVILHIFSFLDKRTLCLGVRLVSSQWYRIQKDPSLWRTFILPRQFSETRLRLMMKQVGQHLHILDCNKCEALTDTCLAITGVDGEMFPNMRKVILPVLSANIAEQESEKSNAQSTLDYMRHLASIFPNLEEIANIQTNLYHTVDILECQSFFPKLRIVHDRPVSSYGRLGHMSLGLNINKKEKWLNSLNLLSEKCPDIESYKCIRGVNYMNTEGISAVAKLSANLKILHLHYMCSITNEAIAEFFSNLKSNKIEEIHFNNPGPLTDIGFEMITEKCPQLKTLSLAKCPDLTNATLVAMINNCSQLEKLSIDNSVSLFDKRDPLTLAKPIKDATIAEITKHTPKLRTFKLARSVSLSWEGIHSLCTNCPNLVYVSLMFCESVNDLALVWLQKLKHLKLLNLRKVSVKPKGIIDFILNAPSLVHLTLHHYGNEFYADASDLMDFTYAAIDADSNKYRPNVIRSLSVRGVGGSFLQLLTVLCPNLSHLDMSDETIVSPFYFRSIIQNCDNLAHLDISSDKITVDDSCLMAIAEHGKHLSKIMFRSSLGDIDFSIFAQVLESCTHLSMMSFTIKGSTLGGNIEYMKNVIMRKRKQCFVFDTRKNAKPEDEPEDGSDSIAFHFLPEYYMQSV